MHRLVVREADKRRPLQHRLRAPSCRPPVFCSTELRATVQSVISSARTRSGQTPPNLLLEHLFNLSDLFLNFAGVFFGVAFGL